MQIEKIVGNVDIPLARFHIIDVPADELVGRILTSAEFGEQVHVVPINPHVFLKTRDDAEYEDIIAEAKYVVMDGIGIGLASHALGRPLRYRITGTDLMEKLVRAAERDRLSIFLLGGMGGSADACAQALTGRFTDLRIAGTFQPPMVDRTEDLPEAEIVETMNATGADIVFVALGVPKQEEFIARNKHRIKAKVLMSVGASVDYFAGYKKRAPQWMRRVGLEWLFRVLAEPRRLGPRYIFGIPRFLWIIGTSLRGQR